MSVNGVSGMSTTAYETQPVSQAKTQAVDPAKTADPTKPAVETAKEAIAPKKENSGVVYEESEARKQPGTPARMYAQNTELLNKLKADTEANAKKLQDIVEQLMTKQSQAFGAANDMWQFLANGKFEVDEATKKQAQEDVSEDGYWGVKQTSGRILDFANALTGGDPSKIEDMRKAFEKGYKAAEKTWGKDLPEISKQTYDAVMKGFDKMAEEAGQAAGSVTATKQPNADAAMTVAASTTKN